MTVARAPIAVIPARGGSKRLPRKNVLPLGGKPMIAHAIEAARQSDLFGRIVVSTEDSEIAGVARDCGAEFYERPDALASDTIGVTEVCIDLVEQLAERGEAPSEFCCIYATAAFILPSDLVESYAVLSSDKRPDAVMGVSEFPIHPYKAMASQDGYLAPVWPEENSRQSQTFPHMVASNGTIYWARTHAFLEHKTFYPPRLLGYILPPGRAIDIDTPEDFAAAERQMELNLMRESHV